MKRLLSLRTAAAAVALLAMTFATNASAIAADELQGIARQVRKELVTLPYYGVFDNFAFRINGTTVTLEGAVTRPTLAKSAERVVGQIEGVDKVENNIEVLPVSPNDDRIRIAVYRSIYYHPNFTRYAIRSVPPIHIIVKNGDVELVGVVNSEMDKQVAGIQANGVSGVFSVTNNLVVEND